MARRRPTAISCCRSSRPISTRKRRSATIRCSGKGRAAQGAYYDRPSVAGGFEIPLDIQSAGFWLHGLMGAPTTTTEAPGYTHLFTAGGATPSKTLEVGHTQLATPSYRRYLGVNFNDFSFSMSPRGVASARINCVAQSRVVAATSIDATPAVTYAVTRFSQGNGLIKVGGTQVAYVTAGDFNFTNSPDVVETIRADGLIDGVDMGQARPSGSMTVRLLRSRDADDAADRFRQPDAGGAAVRLRASGRLVAAVRHAAGAAVRAEGADHRPGRRRAADHLAGGERQPPPATGCG